MLGVSGNDGTDDGLVERLEQVEAAVGLNLLARDLVVIVGEGKVERFAQRVKETA